MQYLKKSQLISGKAYIFKDGRVAVYFGESMSKLYFYLIGSLLLTERYEHYEPVTVILNKELQYKYICELIKASLHSKFNEDLMHILTSMPKLVDSLDIDISTDVNNFIAKSKILGIAELPSFNESERELKSVRTKELEIGKLYIGGMEYLGTVHEGYRNAFIYLGKDRLNRFMWIFVGSPDEVDNNLDVYLNSCSIDFTVSNKKVYTPIYHNDLEYWKLDQGIIDKLVSNFV